MWRFRDVGWHALVSLLLATAACSANRRPQGSAPPNLASDKTPPLATAAVAEVQTRAQALERHLAARDDEVAALQTEVTQLREREKASRAALDTLKAMLQARAARPAIPYTPRLNRTTLAPSEEGGGGVEQGIGNESTEDGSEQGTNSAAGRLRVAESQLATERDKRRQLEEELQRLRSETSVSPYGDSVADELRAARRKIEGLEAALASAQRARDDLADKYAALKAQLDATTRQNTTALRAEVAALQQQQREALAGFEQELAASRAREKEFRDALAAAQQGGDGGSAVLIADLHAENSALRTRLDEEHQRNIVLAGKLKIASRVAEMIFKTRVGQPSVASQ